MSLTNLPTYAICSLFKLPPPRVPHLSLLLSALTILLVFRLPIDPSITLLLSFGMLCLRNFVFTILVTTAIGLHHLMSCCLLVYFTKSLNPISFLNLFLHSLSAIWTDLLVLTLALFIFLHSHFHYSFIFSSSFHSLLSCFTDKLQQCH